MTVKKDINLKVALREKTGRNASRRLRKQGSVPAILYGKDKKDLKSLKVSEREFTVLEKEVSESSILSLVFPDKKEVKAFVQDIAVDPIKGKPIHIDFHKIDLKEEVEVTVPIEFIGDSPAVKEKGGVLLRNLDNLQVKALPMEIPEKVEVRIDLLKEIDDNVLVKDLDLGGKVKVLNNPDDVVAVVTIHKQEEIKEPEKEVEESEEDQPKADKEGEEAKEGEEGKETEGKEEEKSGAKKDAKAPSDKKK